MSNRIARAVAVALAGFATASTAHEGATGGRLGKVEFKVECNAAAQAEFNTAMAYYHSFAWQQIAAPLNRVLQADASCGMAYWLRALSQLDNPFTWPIPVTPAVLAAGPQLLEQARKAGLKSERERDFVEALAVFYKDADKLNHRTRAIALEDALMGVARKHPGDSEALVLGSLVMSANFDPNDRQFSRQWRAARQLEPVFTAQPDHPGVAHYLIHSYDYPPIARHGLDAAMRYAKIAPDATHALHMPSHIFTRVGFWRDSVAANRASADASKGLTFDALHAFDYMVYAHLQLGQDAAARAVAAEARTSKVVDHFGSAYAYAAIPARIVVERGDWAAAANLALFPAADAYPWKKYPQAEAIHVFGRGIGAANAGNVAAARQEHARLIALRDAAGGMKLAYWVEQIDIQATVIEGLAAFADGKRDDGLALLRKAADREDNTQKHAVTPGLLMPAREILAQSLATAGRHGDALREYEAVLDKEPNRYRAFAGAAQAAERAGDMKRAAYWSARLVEQTDRADTSLADVNRAKRVIGM